MARLLTIWLFRLQHQSQNIVPIIFKRPAHHLRECSKLGVLRIGVFYERLWTIQVSQLTPAYWFFTVLIYFAAVVLPNYPLAEHQAKADKSAPKPKDPSWQGGTTIELDGSKPCVVVGSDDVVGLLYMPKYVQGVSPVRLLFWSGYFMSWMKF